MSAAEMEELVVRKRRAEGTPCNEENFLAVGGISRVRVEESVFVFLIVCARFIHFAVERAV